jgi:hypothetical protein
MTRSLILAALLTLAAQPLWAQNKKVYRCDDRAGRVTYSDEACKGGTELNNDDARSVDQRRTAQDAARREARLTEKLARDRLAAEKSAGGPATGLIPHLAAERAARDRPSDKKRTTTRKKPKKNSQGKPPQV